MAKFESLSKSFKTFSALLKSAREHKGWTQAELARESHVALRTIINVESYAKARKIRFDVVVRLAHSLEQSPRQWLEIAGHNDVSDERIGQVLKKAGVSDFFGQEEPARFFESLQKRLESKSPILVCICYRTFSNFNHQAFLAKHLAPLVDKGNLFVALACPYPKILDIDKVSKQTLSRIYFQVRSEVIGVTKEVKAAVKNPKFRTHIGAFSLKEKGYDNCVPPTTGLSEFRPILIKSLSETDADTPVYELSGWLTFLHDQKERWLNIYPPPEKLAHYNDSFLKICTAWKEYFSEIFDSCDFETGSWKKKDSEMGIWTMADMDTQS